MRYTILGLLVLLSACGSNVNFGNNDVTSDCSNVGEKIAGLEEQQSSQWSDATQEKLYELYTLRTHCKSRNHLPPRITAR